MQLTPEEYRGLIGKPAPKSRKSIVEVKPSPKIAEERRAEINAIDRITVKVQGDAKACVDYHQDKIVVAFEGMRFELKRVKN